jgi:hypothetical protein
MRRYVDIWVACAIVGFGIGVTCVACSAAANRNAERVLTMTAAMCAQIAQAKGRTDIAQYCGIAESAVPVLGAALEMTACEVPDAGPRDGP